MWIGQRSVGLWNVLLVVQMLTVTVSALNAEDQVITVGQSAKDFELATLKGDQIKLSEATKTGPVVLVVLRGYPGYQCPLCTKQFAEFLRNSEAIKSSGARVWFVYPGPADNLKKRADEFVSGKDYPSHFQLLLDPDYQFTKAYGLRWDAMGETAFPATFVIDSDRKVRFAKISKTHGDRSRADEVVMALKKLKSPD